jgi:hypothetical protein
MRRRVAKIVLDVGLFVGFIVEFLTREPEFDPDYILHSWVGIALIPIIAFHLSGNWGWVKRVWGNKGADREARLGVLNGTLGVLSAICIITGFPLWFEWSTAGVLVSAHTITGMLAILLMFVHLAWNRKRIMALVRPARSATPATTGV